MSFFVGSYMICCQQSDLWIYLCVWMHSGYTSETYIELTENPFKTIYIYIYDPDIYWFLSYKKRIRGEKLMVYSLSAAEILIEEQESERDAVK